MNLALAIALLILQAASTPPTPAAPSVRHDTVAPAKLRLSAPLVKKNIYPCKVMGQNLMHVHERGGYSTFYYLLPPPSAGDMATLKAIPDCVDPMERDGA